MKKTIICSIPMKKEVDKVIYKSIDASIPASRNAYRYPVNSFLENTLKEEDELRILLLIKKSKLGAYKKNLDLFKEEFKIANAKANAKVDFIEIDTDFEQSIVIYEDLLREIINNLDENSHIMADITYGPKDLPVVVFTALNFAEKFLNSSIDNILYGQATFIEGHATDTKLCDMTPLYYLNSLTNSLQCNDPKKAKEMLKTLLSI